MNVHILIVDDDAAIRESMREFLQMAGYLASTSKSAEDAIEYLKSNYVDVVITDILMGDMDGLEMTDIIKKDYDIDVIVMTGYSADYSYEEAIKKGASDIVFKPVRFEELLLRLKRVLRERQLSQDRIVMMEKLKQLAITDGLTKLYNSRYFYNQVEHEVNRHKRYFHPLSLVLLDIDFFKNYNDTYGHLNGDKVLVRIGSVINSCLRKLDTGFRYGGEEFTILLSETDSKEALNVARRIRESLSREVFTPLPDTEVKITTSMGVTEYADPEEIASFVQRADQAMYHSKKNGRDKISLCLKENASPDSPTCYIIPT